jgi:hypothetical protein
LAFVADAVHGDDASTFHEEPKDACIQFPDMAQLKESVAQRLRQRLAVISPALQFGQTT